MSNINRQDNSPHNHNPKLARYLHRIQQLVGNRGRSTSPLSNRAAKPIKHNLLDHFLKYQLTIKIIHGFYTKKNNQEIRHFFNMIKQLYYTYPNQQFQRTQKIYRFVPIQKTQCAHIIIDTSIGIKMLTNLLKMKIKNNLRIGFHQIKNLNLSDPFGGTLNTARSNKSNFSNFALLFNNQKNIDLRGIALKGILQKIYNKSYRITFNKIKITITNKINENNLNTNTNQNQNKLIQIKSKYLNKILTNLIKNNIKSTFTTLIQHSNNQSLQILQNIRNILKLQNLSKNKYLQNKNNIINIFKQFVNIQKARRYYQNLFNQYKLQQKQKQKQKQKLNKLQNKLQQQQQIQQQQLKQSEMISTSGTKHKPKPKHLNSDMIYNATSKINIVLISIITRRKYQFLMGINKIKTNRIKAVNKIKQIIYKKIIIKLGNSINYIRQNMEYQILQQITQQKAKKQAQIQQKIQAKIKAQQQYKQKLRQKQRYTHLNIKWNTINTLINLQKYFIYTLKQPFKIIKEYSTNRLILQQNLNIFTYYYNRNLLKQAFTKIKPLPYLYETVKSNGNTTRSKNIKKIQIDSIQQTLLPKVLNKLFAIRYVDIFIKIKTVKRKTNNNNNNNNNNNKDKNNRNSNSNTNTNTNTNINKNNNNSVYGNGLNIQWKQDIRSFISQRDRFNQSLMQHYRKMEQILNNKQQQQNLVKYQARKPSINNNQATTNKNKKVNNSINVNANNLSNINTNLFSK